MTSKDKIFIAISIISLLFLLAMGTIERNYLAQHYIARPHTCESDAWICPDGSALFRTFPNCAFSQCPIIGNNTTPPSVSGSATATPVHPFGGASVCTTEAKICPDGSAVGRSGPKCVFAPCSNPPPPPHNRNIRSVHQR